MRKQLFCLILALIMVLSAFHVTALAADGESETTHLFHTPKLENIKEATETEPGYTGDLVCSQCGEVLLSGVEIPTLSNSGMPELPEHLLHTPELVNAKEATETESGYTGDIVCSECGEVLVTGSETPIPEDAGDSQLHIHTPELINTVEATYIYSGYTGDVVCSQCGELLLEGEKTDPTGKDSYLLDNPFEDVKPLAYYYKPVLWAYYGGITEGTSDTTFCPGDSCTRAQIVTFLWRTMGQPEPTIAESPFTDISPDDYYYKAVLWAVETGVTEGTSATTFSPDETCTRCQTLTFLWRCQGKPQAQENGSTFPDVPAGSYYAQAVVWAVEEEITVGYTDGTFRPDYECTRGQVVTFLYRCMTE